MRLFVWIVIVFGAPVYVFNMLIHGPFDAGGFWFAVVAFLLAALALYFDTQKKQAKRNQTKFWANKK